jgi:hypothetical protein
MARGLRVNTWAAMAKARRPGGDARDEEHSGEFAGWQVLLREHERLAMMEAAVPGRPLCYG